MKNVSFKHLKDKSEKDVLKLICARKSKVKLWSKGERNFANLVSEKYDDKSKSLMLDGEILDLPAAGKDTLFNFKIDGIYYFGEGKLKYLESIKTYQLKLKDNLYKCERRRSLRLEVYKTHNFTIDINIDESGVRDGKVLPFIRGHKQGRGFDHAQDIKLKSSLDSTGDDERTSFKVYDFSSKGISFIVGEREKELLKIGRYLTKSLFHIGYTPLTVPKIEIIRVNPYRDANRPRAQLYLIGADFTDIGVDLEKSIVKKINSIVNKSGLKNTFEDFING